MHDHGRLGCVQGQVPFVGKSRLGAFFLGAGWSASIEKTLVVNRREMPLGSRIQHFDQWTGVLQRNGKKNGLKVNTPILLAPAHR